MRFWTNSIKNPLILIPKMSLKRLTRFLLNRFLTNKKTTCTGEVIEKSLIGIWSILPLFCSVRKEILCCSDSHPKPDCVTREKVTLNEGNCYMLIVLSVLLNEREVGHPLAHSLVDWWPYFLLLFCSNCSRHDFNNIYKRNIIWVVYTLSLSIRLVGWLWYS